MSNKEYRPRLSEYENNIIRAVRDGSVKINLPTDFDLDSPSLSPAKILIFDIETAPLRSYTWGVWKQNVAPVQIISDWFMLTWAAKWLFEDDIMSGKLTSEEVIAEDDKRITKGIWELLDEADIVIAHNAKKFDVKRLNTRFLLHGLNPPMPYQIIDTLDTARKQFSIVHNRLDYINEILGLGRKKDTGGFDLWVDCMKGDKVALSNMEEYNIQDVAILEETYLILRPWIRSHPNIGLYIEQDVDACPNCGSEALAWGGTPYTTTANRYESFRCGSCGSLGRSARAMSTDKILPKSRIRPTAR
jgi:hypothetical protein